ncbi:N-6 DNA methylase [Candidatus Dojkabacteria bacterium]|nr:N-6 DNA methylase [Candidatus Dojkabacteria bacterium]
MDQRKQFKDKIFQLVEVFGRNIDQYKAKSDTQFNEAQLREQFLNPMFNALGWDMYNEQGYAEQYKEVVHEDKVEIEGKPKAPDYSFRIGGQRKFFLEAKKPVIKIKTDYDPALQLRRYAWSAHLPVSLLSDFEEFAIYDTAIAPKSSDIASVSRIEYYTYDQYPDIWEKLYDTFAKESILKGSFDRYAEKEKRGKQVVDKSFLSEIEKWREWLAKDIAKNNAALTVEELNLAVQKIIDRLIFLRIAEDRGIERYKRLQELVSSNNSYRELNKYFKNAQQKYNSNLFDFTADTLTPLLHISDNVLDKILKHLYYPTSPYVFDVIGVEVLGNIYEQFLGKVIRLTSSHNAKVEEKPEVKKAGGVYYTPKYIVDYIVKNTVGELVKRKTPKEVSKLKILDPACGSGSFLLGAYEYLLDWHLSYYLKQDDKEKKKLEKKGTIFQKESDDITNWLLTTQEKKRIMLNNIYGVDIDAQAVEVTKLSLALKMLENENQESISNQLMLFQERILPDLSSNIKCGNSLIGSDYWNDKDLSTVTEEEIKKVNAFDWNKEFAEVFRKSARGGKQGGFDAVIRNPPWGAYVSTKEKEYYSIRNFKDKSYNSAYLFIEKSLNHIKKNGYLGFIVPKGLAYVPNLRPIRKILIENSIPQVVIDSSESFYESGVQLESLIIITRKGKFYSTNFILATGYTVEDEFRTKTVSDPLAFTDDRIAIWLDDLSLSIIKKIKKNSIKLNEICESRRGININKYVSSEKNDCVVLGGRDINRYYIKSLRYASKSFIKESFNWQNNEKIVLQELIGRIGKPLFGNFRNVSIKAAIDVNGYYTLDTVVNIFIKDTSYNIKYILAVLNSRLMLWYFHRYQVSFSQLTIHIGNQNAQILPIPKATSKDQLHISNLVEQLILAYKNLNIDSSTSHHSLIGKKIKRIEDKINLHIYKICALNKNEVIIIENDIINEQIS